MNRFDDMNITVDIAPAGDRTGDGNGFGQLGSELAATGFEPGWLLLAAVLLFGGAAASIVAAALRKGASA